jgi:hypothetical protein
MITWLVLFLLCCLGFIVSQYVYLPRMHRESLNRLMNSIAVLTDPESQAFMEALAFLKPHLSETGISPVTLSITFNNLERISYLLDFIPVESLKLIKSLKLRLKTSYTSNHFHFAKRLTANEYEGLLKLAKIYRFNCSYIDVPLSPQIYSKIDSFEAVEIDKNFTVSQLQSLLSIHSEKISRLVLTIGELPDIYSNIEAFKQQAMTKFPQVCMKIPDSILIQYPDLLSILEPYEKHFLISVADFIQFMNITDITPLGRQDCYDFYLEILKKTKVISVMYVNFPSRLLLIGELLTQAKMLEDLYLKDTNLDLNCLKNSKLNSLSLIDSADSLSTVPEQFQVSFLEIYTTKGFEINKVPDSIKKSVIVIRIESTESIDLRGQESFKAVIETKAPKIITK